MEVFKPNKIEVSEVSPFGKSRERFSDTILYEDYEGEELIELSYNLAKKEGLFTGSIEDYAETIYGREDALMLPTQITGEIEEQILMRSMTFGSFEPSYLELLGQEGIQELRTGRGVNCLLVGSLGKYSAQEFSQVMNKINPAAKKHVIDLDRRYIPQYGELKPVTDINLALMNGLEMGIKGDKMDLVCTNCLLHDLLKKDNRSKANPSPENVEKLLSEIHGILQPGGHLLLVEMKYGEHPYKVLPRQSMKEELEKTAERVGYKEIKFLDGNLYYLLRPHNLSATVDENGVARYPKLVSLAKFDFICANLRK